MLPTQCGNGVLQGDEQCECASGTNCRFCSNCKLDEGKECTPDSATPCCDSDGKFLTTSTSCTKMPEGVDGYCNRGVCSTVIRECKIALTLNQPDGSKSLVNLNKFCGASSSNTCRAKCGSLSDSNVCHDTSTFMLDGGAKLQEGALCLKGGVRGECTSGFCNVAVVCGNGAVQGAEECECASGKKQCR